MPTCKYCHQTKTTDEMYVKHYAYFNEKLGYEKDGVYVTRVCLDCMKLGYPVAVDLTGPNVIHRKSYNKKGVKPLVVEEQPKSRWTSKIPEWVIKHLKEDKNCYSRKKYPESLFLEFDLKVRYRNAVDVGYIIEVV